MATYYTLTNLGRAWIEDEAPAPKQHSKVLASLAELVVENDVPRTAGQVSKIAEMPERRVSEALESLVQEGYVQPAKLPQPKEKAETPKLRIRPVEEIAKSEIKRQESQARYVHSEKGKLAHETYEKSEKGQTKNKKYRDSDKGRLAHKAYRIRRRQRELTAWLKTHPEQKAELQPLINECTARLAELETLKPKED